MTEADRAKFDGSIELVSELVRSRLRPGDHAGALQALCEAKRDCHNPDAARAAGVLINDYHHLRANGVHPYIAMWITLTPPHNLENEAP